MKVKKLLVNDVFVDALVKELIDTQTSYVLIDYELYKELHIERGIYRFYSLENKESLSIYLCLQEKAEVISNRTCEETKVQTGYQKLTKKAIKQQNQSISIIRGNAYGKNKLSTQTGRRIKKFKQKEKYFTA